MHCKRFTHRDVFSAILRRDLNKGTHLLVWPIRRVAHFNYCNGIAVPEVRHYNFCHEEDVRVFLKNYLTRIPS